MTLKTKPKFGNGDGNWSKMKDLLYVIYSFHLPLFYASFNFHSFFLTQISRPFIIFKGDSSWRIYVSLFWRVNLLSRNSFTLRKEGVEGWIKVCIKHFSRNFFVYSYKSLSLQNYRTRNFQSDVISLLFLELWEV